MGGNKSGRLNRFEKISAARIGIELGGRQRGIFHLDLFLPEEITAPETPVRAGAAAVDLDLRSLAPAAIEFNEAILAVAENVERDRFPAIASDLNDGILTVADDLNPGLFFAIANNFNPGILAATPVDLNARAPFLGWAIVAGDLQPAPK